MNDKRGERVVPSQRVPGSDILHVEGKPIGYPRTRLDRAAIAWTGGFPNNEISPEKVTFHTRREKDAIRVSGNRILLDYIPGVYRSRKALGAL
jgi:hypothetical protein